MPLAVSVGTAMLASIFVAFAWIPVVLDQTWAHRLVRRSPDGPNELADDHQLDRIVHVLPDLDAPLSLQVSPTEHPVCFNRTGLEQHHARSQYRVGSRR